VLGVVSQNDAGNVAEDYDDDLDVPDISAGPPAV
jgi:hypothetical protein